MLHQTAHGDRSSLFCIHSFEDGNGRIGRALSEQSLSQCLGHPTLIALSHTLFKDKPAYYKALEENNRELNITA
ncbi:MAG: Fic family protein [Nitrospira sp.]|nr:Fic family protein [Nitrospira sp.]